MPQVNVNGVPIQYPATGDVEWGDEATEFAIQVGAVLQKIGQGNQTPTTNNIVIGSISSPGNLTVASGNLTVTTGNTDFGGTLDVTGVTTIVDDLIVDTDTLFVDVSIDRVGINTATPSEALDVTGNALISGTLGVTGNSTFSSNLSVDGNTTLGNASGDSLTINGNAISVPNGLNIDSNTLVVDATNNRIGIGLNNPSTPLHVNGVITNNTGISSNGANSSAYTYLTLTNPSGVTTQLDANGNSEGALRVTTNHSLGLYTNNVNRFQIANNGQLNAVVPGGSTLYPGYLCRAWVNFDGSLNSPITPRGSGNILSITKGSVGVYTITFINNMPDVNYSITMAQSNSDSLSPIKGYIISQAVGNFVINGNRNTAGTNLDANIVCCAVFR
jgi:hypothetical protein